MYLYVRSQKQSINRIPGNLKYFYIVAEKFAYWIEKKKNSIKTPFTLTNIIFMPKKYVFTRNFMQITTKC